MCGICGIFELTGEQTPGQSDLAAMNARLVSRGPDGEGYFRAPGIGLAVRRLAIIDVAGGDQPQSDENETLTVVHNGEIYNYRELTAELAGQGHLFRTRSDTEVILHAYQEWGTAFPKHLRGMFAIALWDGPHRRLVLVRDRFGVKPLYYAQSGGRLLFGSNIRALLAEGSLQPRASVQALESLFATGILPSPLSMLQSVFTLPAAHLLVAEPGKLFQERYWDLDYRPETTPGWAETVRTFQELFWDAVQVRRMSEVPLGALLSGGLDSTSVVAALQALSPEPIHTVSIGFDEPRYDETEYSTAAAQALGTQHHVLHFTSGDFNLLPTVIEELEQPQCSATALPIYLLYRKCREVGLTVVLTGEGADELLGGYHWHAGDARARRLLGLPGPLRALIASAPFKMSAAARRVLREGNSKVVDRYALWQRVASPEASRALLSETARNGGFTAQMWGDKFEEELAGLSPAHQLQYVESHTRLVDFINLEVDRMSMASSTEARAPFLDQYLWEFCARLPEEYKFGSPEKRLLRSAMVNHLPAGIARRPKLGLAAPHRAWLRGSRLPEWAEHAFSPAHLQETGYFVPAEAARLRREHQAGAADHSRILMGILTTQLWHDLFLGHGSV